MNGQRWTRRLLVGGGIAMLAFGVAGMAGGWGDVGAAYLKFVVVVLVLGLLIVMPLTLGVSVLIGRFVPAVARPAVQGACIATVVTVLVAIPALLGFGRARDLPSALPRDYAHGLLLVLALIWATALILIVVRIARHRSRKETPS